MNLKNYFRIGALIAITSLSAQAQHRYVHSEGEAAFGGYDLVSYFQGSGPVIGKQNYTTRYDGLTLLFANMSNLQEFKRDPKKYMPAYGGYCATAVSSQNLIVPNFTNFEIQNERLLFFETRGFFNGKTEWNKDPQLNEILADRHYRQTFEEDN